MIISENSKLLLKSSATFSHNGLSFWYNHCFFAESPNLVELPAANSIKVISPTNSPLLLGDFAELSYDKYLFLQKHSAFCSSRGKNSSTCNEIIHDIPYLKYKRYFLKHYNQYKIKLSKYIQ